MKLIWVYLFLSYFYSYVKYLILVNIYSSIVFIVTVIL